MNGQNEPGFTLHFGWIAIILIIIATFIFGWKTLIVVAGLIALITFGVWINDLIKDRKDQE